MNFNIGDQVKRKTNGERGVVTAKPATARSAPQGYVYVWFETTDSAAPIHSSELEKAS